MTTEPDPDDSSILELSDRIFLRPERKGGSGWKAFGALALLLAIMGIADVIVIDHDHLTGLYDGAMVLLTAAGGGTFIVNLIRTLRA